MVTALNTASIIRGVPQGTVPDLFSIFILFFFLTLSKQSIAIVKFADYMTISLQFPIYANVGLEESEMEVLSFIESVVREEPEESR